MRLILALTCFAALAACSNAAPPTDPAALNDKVKEATLAAIANATPDNVTISDVAAGAAKVTWKASVDGVIYQCDADNEIRLPDCRSGA